MIVKKIKLQTLDDVKQFVTATALLPFDVDLRSDRFVVDGKSILGIFSLNLAHPITLNLHTEPCKEAEEFLAGMEKHFI